MKERLESLRRSMREAGIDAWYISGSDPHQSEYVAGTWRSREWISGFTGSAGKVIVTKDKAFLWVDSRYYLQADMQTDPDLFTVIREGMPGVQTPEELLIKTLAPDSCLGFDGSTVSVEKFRDLKNKLSAGNVSFKFAQDLLSPIWKGRPEIPRTRVKDFPIKFSGMSRSEKLEIIRNDMIADNADGLFIASLDDIAWSLNYRSADIAYSPVAVAYLFLTRDECRLFIREDRLDQDLLSSFSSDGIAVCPYEDAPAVLKGLQDGSILVYDPKRISIKLADLVPDTVKVMEKTDYTTIRKACKNPVEADGMREAHRQDGASMLRWWKWLEENLGNTAMDEVSVADVLGECRQKGENFESLSFSPICGFGPNGAIVHYSADKDTAAEIHADGVLLLDSGGHYLTGTTDITRTFGLGSVDKEVRQNYTKVLKGHLAVVSAVFPVGTSGSRLDTLARLPLWKSGYNYGHGTGHGVGHYLNVHEGPAGISPLNHVPLQPGMVLSNEPGMYLEGRYGIRIENLILVKRSENFEDYLEFEDITVFPYDLSLIDTAILSDEETALIDRYHRRVRTALEPLLNDEENEFLRKKTRALRS